MDRVNADRGDAEADKISLGTMMKHALDLKLWAFGCLFCCSTMPSYAFSYFLPVILAGGGYDVKMSLCLSAPRTFLRPFALTFSFFRFSLN
jgi:hypothetical protein